MPKAGVLNREMARGLTCRFGDPRKENCDMMCRPLRAVMVGHRYAIIVSARGIRCGVSPTESLEDTVEEHFSFPFFLSPSISSLLLFSFTTVEPRRPGKKSRDVVAGRRTFESQTTTKRIKGTEQYFFLTRSANNSPFLIAPSM